MYVTSVDEVEEIEMSAESAHSVKVKYLLHEGVGAKKLQFLCTKEMVE
ncbi:MAG: hypothetical protein OEW71_06020 [Candidatus Bathyarchaeota archaeon]|nr:hypothetical protein [Candidatus Bathyarchaeota archaeon]